MCNDIEVKLVSLKYYKQLRQQISLSIAFCDLQ